MTSAARPRGHRAAFVRWVPGACAAVWRDFDGDWGRDVLAEHCRRGRQAALPK